MVNESDLKEGEVICSKCEGRGSLPSKFNPYELASICPKCGGEGKVDWITNAMGEKKREPLYGSSSYGNMGISSSYNYCGSTSGAGLPVVKNPPAVIAGSIYVNGNTKTLNVYTGDKWEEVDDS